MSRFVVQVRVKRDRDTLATRYIGTDAANGMAAIYAAREQMAAEHEPPAGCRATYYAKPHNPFGPFPFD